MGELKEGKVKLTEAGADTLSAWMRRTGTKPSDLAGAMGTHGMVPSRALKRQGWLTLEQAGRLVAYAGGELTAEQLFGLERAGAVPAYPPRQRKAVVAPAAAPPPAPASPGADPELAELDESAAGADLPATKRALVALRDDAQAAPGTRVAAASKLAVIAIQEERLKMARGQRAAVDRAALKEKMQALLFHARRQWGEATGSSYLTSGGKVLTAVPGAEEEKPAEPPPGAEVAHG